MLCELQMAMLERDIEFGEDISREIMKDDVRDIQDQSYRNLRDWYIYRDYMNGLEYIIHAFDFLKRNHHHGHSKWSSNSFLHKVLVKDWFTSSSWNHLCIDIYYVLLYWSSNQHWLLVNDWFVEHRFKLLFPNVVEYPII